MNTMQHIMKDSGVEWIGKMPKHWSCVPMKFMLNERNQKNDPVVTSERLSLSIDIGVTLYAEKKTNLDRFKEDVSQYKVAHAGDLVLNSMNMIVGAVGIAPLTGCVSPAYYVFYDTDDSHTVTKFCNYIFKNKRLRGCLFSLGQGIMAIDRGDGRVNTCRLKVSREDLGRIMLPCPAIEEQRKIISFLDKKCAVIDDIIAEAKASIEEYKAWKASVIFEAVTKGLNPDAKMKDSGVEWIGLIPSHWDVKRLKYVAVSLSKGNGITKDETAEDGDTPCVRYGEIYTKYNQSFTECQTRTYKDIITSPKYFTYGDILITCTGELVEEIGKSVAYLGSEKCLAGGDIIVLKHTQNASFLNYALNCNYAQSQKSCNKAKLKVVHISAFDIGNIWLVLPPLSEQATIAAYLDEKCAGIDGIIAEKESLISELETYKKSLIFETVTGKRRIC